MQPEQMFPVPVSPGNPGLAPGVSWSGVRAHSIAQELEAARELRLHGLLADAQPVGDLGVAQAIDQARPL